MIYLIVGFPACGKSTYSKKLSKETGALILNRTIISKTIPKLVKLFESHIQKNDSVILDNMNLSKKTRKLFIDKANEYNKKIKCIYIKDNIENCMIKGMLRMYEKYGAINFLGIDEVKPVVFFKSRKELEEPELEEGFEHIEIINGFVPNFKDNKNKCVFLDIDGTLRKTDILEHKYPTKINEVKLLFNQKVMHNILSDYQKKGYLFVGVSNQSGIAKQIVSEETVIKCFDQTKKLLDFEFPITFCPHSPFPLKCFCRKPQSGLFLDAILKYNIDPEKSVMIGDRTEDKTGASRLNIKYMTPVQFFRDT